MRIPLQLISINWFFETGNSTDVRRLFPNTPPDGRMFTASTEIQDLSNFTFGPVRSVLSVRNVDADQEGAYSCAGEDLRIFQGCLFVLGKLLLTLNTLVLGIREAAILRPMFRRCNN